MKSDLIVPNISIETYYVGKDMIFIVTGGEAHIGATATAYLENNDVSLYCKELPHHKEGELAAKMAQTAAEKLKVTVTVIVGIHIDNANHEQILNIVNNAHIKFEQALSKLVKNSHIERQYH